MSKIDKKYDEYRERCDARHKELAANVRKSANKTMNMYCAVMGVVVFIIIVVVSAIIGMNPNLFAG